MGFVHRKSFWYHAIYVQVVGIWSAHLSQIEDCTTVTKGSTINHLGGRGMVQKEIIQTILRKKFDLSVSTDCIQQQQQQKTHFLEVVPGEKSFQKVFPALPQIINCQPLMIPYLWSEDKTKSRQCRRELSVQEGRKLSLEV